MLVKVRLSEPLRSKVGARRVELALSGEAASLADVVAELVRRYPAVGPDLEQPASALDANYTIFHNDKVIRFAERDGIEFQDDDELSIFLPMAGGWSGHEAG